MSDMAHVECPHCGDMGAVANVGPARIDCNGWDVSKVCWAESGVIIHYTVTD